MDISVLMSFELKRVVFSVVRRLPFIWYCTVQTYEPIFIKFGLWAYFSHMLICSITQNLTLTTKT